MESIHAIELSNSSYNGTSSLLSTIVLITFLLFTIITGAKIYNKVNPNNIKDPNIFNALVQNTMGTIQYLMGDITKKNIDDMASNYRSQISDLKTSAELSANALSLVSTIITGANQTIYNKFKDNLGKLGDFLTSASGVINKLSSISDASIKNFEGAYIAYQKKLQSYVDGMVSMMQTVANQIQQAAVIQPLFGMITPLKRVFDGVRDTLKTNMPFIKQFYPEFDLDANTPSVNSNLQPNLGASFKTSSAILQQSGYK